MSRTVAGVTEKFGASLATMTTISSLAGAGQDQVFDLIKSCSYPNNKAKHLLGMARMLNQEFGGVVPDTLEELQKLPGVGR